MTVWQKVTFEEWAKLFEGYDIDRLRELWDTGKAPGVVFEGEYVFPAKYYEESN